MAMNTVLHARSSNVYKEDGVTLAIEEVKSANGAAHVAEKANLAGTMQYLCAANTAAIQDFKVATRREKVIQCVVPAAFTGVSIDVHGSNDAAVWSLLVNFTASGSVTNTDPFTFIRAKVNTVTGTAATASNVVAVEKTTAANITGGTLASFTPYLAVGKLWLLTTTAFAIGDHVLIADFAGGTPQWNGVKMPVIDKGSTQTVLFDRDGTLTDSLALVATTLDVVTNALIVTLGS